MNTVTSIKVVFGMVGLGIGTFLGGWDGFLIALLTFVVIDYLTGVIVAIQEKKLNSGIGMKGITKKVLIFLMVGLANVVDNLMGITGDPIRTGVIFFYIANEGLSITENVGKAGVPFPDKLKNVITQLKDKP